MIRTKEILLRKTDYQYSNYNKRLQMKPGLHK